MPQSFHRMFNNIFVIALRRSQVSKFDKLRDHRARCDATPKRKDSTHGVPYQSCATLIDSSARREQAAVAMLRMALSKISGDAASICSA
jgi:hypothetical protein